MGYKKQYKKLEKQIKTHFYKEHKERCELNKVDADCLMSVILG
jgi:predicted transposase YbfD/YdcC